MTTATASELMTREDAAAYLGVEVQTLACWATTGRYGLPFIKVGTRVKYRKSDLDQWLECRTVRPVEV